MREAWICSAYTLCRRSIVGRAVFVRRRCVDPALSHNGQRKAIRSACALASLRVRQLVVEPTAEALAYSFYSATPNDNFKLFLTFDMGGGTIDYSVLRCTGVDFQVLGVQGNSSLGGIDFDAVVGQIMLAKFAAEHGREWDAPSAKMRAFPSLLATANVFDAVDV